MTPGLIVYLALMVPALICLFAYAIYLTVLFRRAWKGKS